jgi:carbamoyltransferase
MYILGISAFYHDSAAALIKDGAIVAAAQEERFSRRRHDPGFPQQAIRYCLDAGGIAARDLAHVAFYDKPFLKFERLLESYLACAPQGFSSFRLAMPVWLREKLFLRGLLQKEMRKLDRGVKWNNRLLFAEHHLSHAASAFFPSPFAEAVVLTLDAVGEWATTSVAIGRGRDLEITKELHFPHSLGMLYSAFTYHAGFKVNSGEYKLMGLAPYGTPRFTDQIYQHLIDLKTDGSFRLNLDYFDYCVGLRMTNGRFDELFGGRPRQPEEPIEQRHMDMAASIQKVTEEVVLRMVRTLAEETKMDNLCLAGGVALNCVANGRILEEGGFRQIWIQPAAGDAGGAVGAALQAYHGHAKGERHVPIGGDGMNGALLGPEFSEEEIEAALTAAGAKYRRLPEAELLAECARCLADGKALGWVQGRMEFGPRALGARSILADPRSPEMQKTLNLKVKYRESFRPFAPAVLAEDAAEWFKLEVPSPYMLLVAAVADRHLVPAPAGAERPAGLAALAVPRSTIPAVTHIDLSARVQTVSREQHPKFHALISEFKRLTACPVLVNTSFNVRGEPIVCTPEDAYRCFMGSGIEVLAIGNCLLLKEEQPRRPEMENYHANFEAD